MQNGDLRHGRRGKVILKAVIDDGQVPYCDFAIFGPHANRRQRKMKLHGSRFTSTGEIGPIEIVDVHGNRQCELHNL